MSGPDFHAEHDAWEAEQVRIGGKEHRPCFPSDLCVTRGCGHRRDEHSWEGCRVEGKRPGANFPAHADDCLAFSESPAVPKSTEDRWVRRAEQQTERADVWHDRAQVLMAYLQPDKLRLAHEWAVKMDSADLAQSMSDWLVDGALAQIHSPSAVPTPTECEACERGFDFEPNVVGMHTCGLRPSAVPVTERPERESCAWCDAVALGWAKVEPNYGKDQPSCGEHGADFRPDHEKIAALARTLEADKAELSEANDRLHQSWKVLHNRSAHALTHYSGQRLPGLVADRMSEILRGLGGVS